MEWSSNRTAEMPPTKPQSHWIKIFKNIQFNRLKVGRVVSQTSRITMTISGTFVSIDSFQTDIKSIFLWLRSNKLDKWDLL